MLKLSSFIISTLIVAFTSSSLALKLDLIGDQTLSPQTEFQKTRVGGLSALYYDETLKKLFALSDDRGKINEPRFYQFQVDLSEKSLEVKPNQVTFIKNKSQKSFLEKDIDPEGLSTLPWGNLLITSEGDNNQKPRVMPQILEVKMDGSFVRDYAIPDHYLPELSGKQNKGTQNNRGFEGLTFLKSQNKVFAMMEDVLEQDQKNAPNWVRLLVYSMPEAWTLKATEEYFYPIDPVEQLGVMGRGVSEILVLNEKTLLVLERAAYPGEGGVENRIRIYAVELDFTKNILKSSEKDLKKMPVLSKKLVLDLNDIKSKLKSTKRLDNFEGMTLGPRLKDGRPTLIIVSDDNFNSLQQTIFLAFAIQE